MYAGKMIKNRNGKLVPACPKCGRPMKIDNTTKGGSLRWQCRPRIDGKPTYCYSTTQPGQPPRTAAQVNTEQSKVFQRFLKATKRLVITAAQNATPVHGGFLAALETYVRENNASCSWSRCGTKTLHRYGLLVRSPANGGRRQSRSICGTRVVLSMTT
jgi:hypothetical protein